MDDEKKEASRASTSKIEEQSNNSRQDLEDEEDQDVASINYDTDSSMYSVRSGLDTARLDVGVSKLPSMMRKFAGKKKLKRRTGKIQKRKRVKARSQPTKRVPRRLARVRKYKRNQDLSMSAIIRGSSRSKDLTCRYCGHRCCRRRFKDLQRRLQNRKYRGRKNKKLESRNKRRKAAVRRNMFVSGLEHTQAGSRSKMLSPLFVSTNETLMDSNINEDQHCKVSPEMIFEALKRLSMWRQGVMTATIVKYLKMNYPVNPNDDELENELREKLRIATIVGIVTQLPDDTWALNGALQKRKMADTHVTLFWKIYSDTMSPIAVQKPEANGNGKISSSSMTHKEDIL